MSVRIHTGRKYGKLTCADVLYLLEHKVYTVNPDTGEVFGRDGKPVKATDSTGTQTNGRGGKLRYYVRLSADGKRIDIARAKLVWMAVTGIEPPDGFEVHHDDEQPDNDTWSNLICLHTLDHRKQHNRPRAATDDTIPF